MTDDDLVTIIAGVYVAFWRIDKISARDRQCAISVLAELRRRGAWLPGDPLTAEIYNAVAESVKAGVDLWIDGALKEKKHGPPP